MIWKDANWQDPAVPAGNAPPLPRWPVVVSGAAWLAMIVFLVTMAAMRL